MTFIVISLLLYTCILLLEIIPHIKKKNHKVVLIILPIFIITLVINVLFGMGYHIPSPAVPIKNFVDAIIGPSG